MHFSNKPFYIYRSSAGSGKTYRLSLEYVKLALQAPFAFRQILAITFTNKATREMKARIILFIQKLGAGQGGALEDELCESFGWDREMLRQQAKLVLRYILHNYSSFAISTIDSFFQRIIKSFAREIGLLGNYKVEMDQEKVLATITDQLLEELGSNKRLTRWVLEYADSKVDENRSWDIRYDIKQLAGELFKEACQIHAQEITELAKDQNFYDSFQKELTRIKAIFEKQMKEYGLAGQQLMQQHSLEVADFAFGKSGVGNYFIKIADKKDFDYGARVISALEDPDAWMTKSSKKKEAIQACVAAGLQGILQEAVLYRDENFLTYNTAVHIHKNLFVFGLLSDLLGKLKNYRDENDVTLISDNNLFLRGIISDNDAPFIYEKTGSRYQHYLIDEFQDTSSFQWDNLQPLIENSLAENNLNLVVGDVKQSIYRWRGGDWELMAGRIHEEIPLELCEEVTMQTNWRSCKNIIDFNNTLFEISPDFLQAKVQEEIAGALIADYIPDIDIQSIYKDARQELPDFRHAKGAEEGKVWLKLFDRGKGNSKTWREEINEYIPDLIELLQEKGYAASEIAILVRRRSEGDEVVRLMMERKASVLAKPHSVYDIISPESLRLDSAPVVRLLLNAIRFLQNDKQRLINAELTAEWFYSHWSTDAELMEVFKVKEGQAIPVLPEAFTANLAKLLTLPVLDLTESLIRIFELQQLKGQQAFLQAFQDAVIDCMANGSSDAGRFLTWWEESGYKRALQIPESHNAMRIMTIHKSKGLQFKAVVIPYCDWPMSGSSGKNSTIMWRKTEEEPFAKAGYFPILVSSKLKQTLYAANYLEEYQRGLVDNLNLLYVALTRAEECLCVLAPDARDDKPSSDVSALLHNLISTGNSGFEFDSEQNVYSLGTWPVKTELTDPTPERKIPGEYVLEKYAGGNWSSKLKIATRSAFPGTEPAQMALGNQVHHLLSAIDTFADSDRVIRNMVREGSLAEEKAGEMKIWITHLFDNPQIRQWFETDWEVRNELSILRPDDTPQRPDRVLIKGKQAVIIDFKTGFASDSHHKQLGTYKELLQEMGYTPVEAYLIYFSQSAAVEIVQVK
ncbi:MAG: UvrD-helicase domain-containing protein [Cyclobacteriaceae bacterium]